YNKFMRGLQGGKMSSSKEKSYIALTDSVEDAKAKIDKAKTGGRDTLEEHREKGAKVEEDMVFELLAYHLIEDDSELERIREEYSNGEMLSGELKQIAKDRIEEFLVEHQRKREEAEEKVDQYVRENLDFEL
ncbi:MAG: tryptophan--tRNA ligase, partial [Candidatus Nanohaloarchaea archaeon]